MENVKIKLTEQNEIEEVFNEDIEIPKPFIIVPSSVWQKFSIYKKEDLLITNQTISLKNNVVLEKEKKKKLLNINTLCEAAIVGGFTSSALGSVHVYQSDRDDQINLIGLVTAGADDLLKCGVDDGNGNITWDWKQHTAAQLKAVFDDGALFKKQQLIKANTLKAQVAAATTAEELDGIVW